MECPQCGRTIDDASVTVHRCRPMFAPLEPRQRRGRLGQRLQGLPVPAGLAPTVLGWLAVIAAAGMVVTCAVWLDVLQNMASVARNADGGSNMDVALALRPVALRERQVISVEMVVFWLYLPAFLGWWFATRRSVRRYGDAGRAVLRHWSLRLWKGAILASALLAFANRQRPAFDPQTGAGSLRDLVLDYTTLTTERVAMWLVVAQLLIVAVVASVRRIWALRAPARSSPAMTGPTTAPV